MKPHTVLLTALVILCLASAHADAPPVHDHWDLVVGAIVSIVIAYLGDRRVHRVRNKTATARLRAGLEELSGTPLITSEEKPYPKA